MRWRTDLSTGGRYPERRLIAFYGLESLVGVEALVEADNTPSVGAIFVLENTGALLAGNTVTNNPDGILLLDSDTSRVVGNTATDNSPDLADFNLPACSNSWLGNVFVTDNEGNGPGAGTLNTRVRQRYNRPAIGQDGSTRRDRFGGEAGEGGRHPTRPT